ncbi:MAG TPA: hypothetical protein VHU92_06935 [Streptosporangiaceae bacterium]|nr:hypothetical protein [Streptosporangiaceae bacterium]
MAPPIPGARRPVPVHRRSAADVVIGLLAIVALIALTAGVPFALVTIFGLPIPHSMPSLSVFTHQLDVFAVIKVLMVLVWLAWIQLVFCVIVEIRAAVRNAGMPARVPLAGGTQMMVHRLVTAALLLVTATTALSPAFAHTSAAAPPPRPAAVTSSAVPAYLAPGQHTAPAAQEESDYRAPTEKIYVVKPPVGRYHESLWEIAENHLGDGRRYREIFELNKDRVQPDGSMLTMASLIRPGWVLHMPADAHGPGIEVMAEGHHRHAADHESGPRTVERDHAHQAQGHDGAGRHGGMTAGPVAPAPQHGVTFPDELAAASLLAAGVLAALGRRRREQLWRRAFGTRIEAPAPSAAGAEVAMRLGAQEPLTWLLDTGLRYLSQALGQEGRTPPTVVAAHLSAENLDLWVTPADPGAPAPWTAVGDGQVWRLPAAALHRLDPEQVAGALAPFPGLVSLGTDSGGRVLVDLEAAHGLICLDGPGETVTSALSAMVVELATNRWSDQMSITLVGFGQDLTQLAPDRITAVPTLSQALPALEARAAEVANAMAMAGIGSVLTGRARGGDPRTWAPHYLIMATTPSPEEQQRLLALAAIRHAAAAGYVVAGDVPGAAWTWSINGDGQLIANQLGFDVQAQLLPPGQHAAIVELFAAAGQPPSAPLDPAPAGSVPQAQLVPGSVMPVEITVLGPVSVQAPGIIEPDRVSLITELIVYLAVHPEGVHPNVLASAVWPRGVTSEVRDAALTRATEWLGMDPVTGQPHLETDPAGRLGLGPGVRVDWQVFKALAGLAQPARDGGEEESYLAQALGLVNGQLLTGRDPGRYAWLAADDLEYEVTARVADAAHRLSSLRLGSGDAPGAMAAARAGLRLAFADELLWRDLLLAAHATRDEHLLRSVVDEVCARTALDEVLPRMAPETEALIDEICPSWRASVA